MADSDIIKINRFLINNFENYNINDLYNNFLNNQYILKLNDYNEETNNYIDKLLKTRLIDITRNDILKDRINYYHDDFKISNDNMIGSIDIDLSFYASNPIQYYSMILDFLTEYYRNLANIIKDKEYLDNNSLYEHQFEIKMRYGFEDSRIKLLTENKIFKFKLKTNQDTSGYKEIIMPNDIDEYTLFDATNQNEFSEEDINSYIGFINNYIIDKNYLNFDINKLDYYYLLSKSYLHKFYKLLLNYHISKAIYFYFQNNYKSKVPEINEVIKDIKDIFTNFELILNDAENDLSILTIVENTQKKQKVLEEKKKKEINKLNDKIKMLKKTTGNETEIARLEAEIQTLYANGYITTDQAKVNEAIKIKKDLHNINKNLIDNQEKIKKLDDTIKSDKSYLNQVNIIMYICIFVLIIIFFTFSITNLTNVNISVAITLLIISLILYFSSNYYINNSNHEHKKSNLFSNLFNNFIIIENYDSSSVQDSSVVEDSQPVTQGVSELLTKLRGLFNDEQINMIIDQFKNDGLINEDGYVGGDTESNLMVRIDDIIDNQFDNPLSQYENNISLKRIGESYPDYYNLLQPDPLDDNLDDFGLTNNTVYNKFYDEIGDDENIIILPNDGNDVFTEYELNIPLYFGDSYKLTYSSSGESTLEEEKLEDTSVLMDIIVVGGGSAGQSFTNVDNIPSTQADVELGSGGSGGAVIQKTDYRFTAGKYIIGVGRGGRGSNTVVENENIEKSGKGSYIKKENTDDNNNFIIFACGGLYKDVGEETKKTSKSGGIVGIVNNIDFTGDYKTIQTNIINIPGIENTNGLILNNDEDFSKGGEGGDIELSDFNSTDTPLFITNTLTENNDYMIFYTDMNKNGGNNYEDSKKHGKSGVTIVNFNSEIIKDSFQDKIIKDTNIYLSGGGGAIGICSQYNQVNQVVANAGKTTLYIRCDGETNVFGYGGVGGGGDGNHGNDGNNGLDGTGSGGGGGGYTETESESGTSYKGGNGGSGIVILKYNKNDLTSKFSQYKEEKKKEIKTNLLQAIANGNLLKLQTTFQQATNKAQELDIEGGKLSVALDTARDKRQLITEANKEILSKQQQRDMTLYGFFKKNTTTNGYNIISLDEPPVIIYKKQTDSQATLFKIKADEDYDGVTDDDGYISLNTSDINGINYKLMQIFDNQAPSDDLSGIIIIGENDVDFLLNNKDELQKIDDIYVPGVIYLRQRHENYVSNLRALYQQYGTLLSENEALKLQERNLQSDLDNLDTELGNLRTERGDQLLIKAEKEKIKEQKVGKYNQEVIKQAEGNLCLSIVNELIYSLKLKTQNQQSKYTADSLLLRRQLSREQDKARKAKNDAREAKKEALQRQKESEKLLEIEKQNLLDELKDQNLEEDRKSFLIDFEFDLDYRIAGNLLDKDDTDIFSEENIEKQNRKRKIFEDKIKRELYEALRDTYEGTEINISTDRFEINRISSGNLYDTNKTRQNEDYLTVEEQLQRRFTEEFFVEEHFIDAEQTLQKNRMVVEMEILPSSNSFLSSTSYDGDTTARDILYKILNVTSCKETPDGEEPNIINIDNCKDNKGDNELLDSLDSKLRKKRYFRYLTRYRVGEGMTNFLQHYLKYTNDGEVIKNEIDSTWIDVIKTDGLYTSDDLLIHTYDKIIDINGYFTEIDRLRFQQETYYDKMNPLLKKEYKKYDEIENNNNIYKKMKYQSDNINTYDIRLKEILINYFVTLSILVSLYLIIIHYVNHIIILLILILIIVVMSVFLLMNIYQIVKTRANKNYWPKENKFLEINI